MVTGQLTLCGVESTGGTQQNKKSKEQTILRQTMIIHDKKRSLSSLNFHAILHI